VLTNRSIVGVAATDHGIEVVNSPIIHGLRMYVTVGASHGCELIHLRTRGESFKAERVYVSKNLSNHHGKVMRFGEHHFGFGENHGRLCQNFSSGELVWSE